MVMTDAFTKMAVLRVIPNKLATTTAQTFLEAWVYTFGVPRVVITDQGNEFKGQFDTTLRDSLQSKHIATTPYHPQSNGQVEVFNRTLAHYLRTMIEDCQVDTLEWEAYIMPLQFAYNTSVHRTTMTTPFFAQFGYDPMVPLWKRKDKAVVDQSTKFNDPVSRILHVNHKVHTLIRQRLPDVRKRQDEQYNRKHQTQVQGYHIGDRVWVERLGIPTPNPKLTQKWEEAVIINIMPNNNLRVSRYNRAKHKEIVIHVDKVRPMVSATPPSQDDDNASPSSSTSAHRVDEIDPRDMPILDRLYQGLATEHDVQTLMAKGYVIVFPNKTFQPTAYPQPGPRVQAVKPQQEQDQELEDQDATPYTWQRQRPIRQPTPHFPKRNPEGKPEDTSRHKQQDKLARLAKQLQIPSTSTFQPAPSLPGRQLRDRSQKALDTLNKLGDKILSAPSQLKDAYVRSGQRELNRLNEAAIEIFHRNQLKYEEKRRQQRLLQERVAAHLLTYTPEQTHHDPKRQTQ